MQLIATYPGATLFQFSVTGPEPQPRITVFYMSNDSEEDGESDEEDGESDEDMDEEDGESDDDTSDEYIFIVGYNHHREHEKERLLQRLPPRDSYIRVPLAHRMTSTNVSDRKSVV